MNEFTKEELQEIISEFQGAPGPLNTNQVWGLVSKIQSMIDNFCDHEYQDYPPGTGAIPFCIKCRRYF